MTSISTLITKQRYLQIISYKHNEKINSTSFRHTSRISRRKATMSGFLASYNSWSNVKPRDAGRFVPALLKTRSSAVFRLLPSTARCNGVDLSFALESISAPISSGVLVISEVLRT